MHYIPCTWQKGSMQRSSCFWPSGGGATCSQHHISECSWELCRIAKCAAPLIASHQPSDSCAHLLHPQYGMCVFTVDHQQTCPGTLSSYDVAGQSILGPGSAYMLLPPGSDWIHDCGHCLERPQYEHTFCWNCVSRLARPLAISHTHGSMLVCLCSHICTQTRTIVQVRYGALAWLASACKFAIARYQLIEGA